MTRLFRYSSVALILAFAGATCLAQSSGDPGSAQAGSASATSSSGSTGKQTADGTTASTSDTKKKKVWTNDDVDTLSGPVSVVGNSKKTTTKAGDGTAADPQYIASAKKQLEKLQSQLDDTKNELKALRDFQEGKAPEPAGYPLGKGYNRVPVDQQIASLEAKQKQLEDKISDLLDEARKKGVLPGQLR
jgi:hypothetical protein